MQAFIDMACNELGIGTSEAEAATGGLLSLLKHNLDGGDFAQMMTQLPGAEKLLVQAKQDASSSLLGNIANAIGGSSGLTQITSVLLSSGLTSTQMTQLADMFIDFIKEQAGDVIANKVSSSLPDLAKLAA